MPARNRLPIAALAVLVAVLALALAPQAHAAGCPASQRKTCVAIPAKRVVKTGAKAVKGVKLPYVLLKGVKRLPKKGATVEIPAGKHDREGFAGVVIGVGSKGDRTVIVAVPPLPTISQAAAAARQALVTARTSASGSLLDLIPAKVLAQAAELVGAPQCGTGVGEFPIKLTGLSLDPKHFSITGPVFSGSRLSGFGVDAGFSPSAQLQLGVTHQAKCEWKKELASVEFPPGVAIFPGPPPFIVRVSGEVSASGSFDGSASGTVSVGASLKGGVTYSKGSLGFSPAPTVEGTAKVDQPLAVRANATADLQLSLVTRMLFYRLWGPRLTLSFGPQVSLNAVDTSPSASTACSRGKLTFPLKLGAGFGMNPGAYYAVNSTVKKLAEQFQADFDRARFTKRLTINGIDTGSVPLDVYNLRKAFDTPDLASFTGEPINGFDLPIQGAGASTTGTACSTVQFTGSGSIGYDNHTFVTDSCGATIRTRTQQTASGLAWDDKWVNQVFGGRANSAALNGTESDTGTVTYDVTNCTNNGGTVDPCTAIGLKVCTVPWYGVCSGAITQGQLPTLEYSNAGDHLVGKAFIGYAKTLPCLPAFQTSGLGGTPMYAVFDLLPVDQVQTTSVNYALSTPVDCATAAYVPPPAGTVACTYTPDLVGKITVTGPFQAAPPLPGEQMKFALKPVG